MNGRSELPDDFVSTLLAQDDFLSSPELVEHRRQVLARLAQARTRERRARRLLFFAWGGCIALVALVFVIAARHVGEASDWPDPLRYSLAMAILLSPVVAALLLGIYLFRYRSELVRAKTAAREQALLDIPRQLNELREQLRELKAREKKEREQPGAGTESGFTLMELLVVISILAVLASLLLPSIAQAKARARLTVCKNNLGQMSKALTAYESDFHYFPGTEMDPVPTAAPPFWTRSPDCWLAKLAPYLVASGAVYTCPEFKKVVPNSECSGYNAGGSCQINYPPHNLGLGLGAGFGWVRASEVKAPADMLALGDLELPNNVFRFVISPWHKLPLGSLYSVIPDRHAGGVNMAFVDSHIEWENRERWIAETDAARLRWNHDHLPHRETW
jgi:prepilin-type N-terminal cleavage/methylation domain-containing protein/prepilin-type processing-associated H-X9-DG protein